MEKTKCPLQRTTTHIKWKIDRVLSWWSSFFCTYSSTAAQVCCTCAVKKNARRTTDTRRNLHHGHHKGTHPRASQGCALIRTRTYFSAANTLLRNRASRGHLNLYLTFTKLTYRANMEPPRRVALGGSVRGAAKRPSFSVGGAFETGSKLDLAALTVLSLREFLS